MRKKEKGVLSLIRPEPAAAPHRPAFIAAAGWLFFLGLIATPVSAVEWEMMDKFVVNGASTLKSSASIVVPDTQSGSLWASSSTLTPHLYVSTGGKVGIGTAGPAAPLTLKIPGADLGFNSGVFIDGAANGAAVGRGSGVTMQSHDVYVAGMYGIRQMNGWNGALAFYTHVGSAGNTFGATFTEKMRIDSDGNVGISTGAPQGRLDVLAAGSAVTDMAQIWRNSGGVIQGSMSATGVMTAKKFIGDGSLLTSISASGLAGAPALTFGTANSAGSAGTLLRTDASIAIFNDGAAPDPLGAAAAGTDAYAARRDHVHALPYGGTGDRIYGTNSGATAGEWKAVTVTAAGSVGAVTTLSMNNQLSNSYANTAALNLTGAGAGITFSGTGPNQIITNNADLALMPGTAQVGIGNSAPAYKLDVSGDLRIYGGHLGVGDASPSSVSTVYGSETYPADTAVYGQRLLTTLSTQTLTASRTDYGSYSRLDNSSDDAGAFNLTLYGGYSAARNVAARTVDSARGMHAFVDNTHASGIITNAYGLVADVGRTAGTITTGYGVYISATDAANPYGLYQAGGGDTNYFAGAVGIGRNPPGGKLDVQAAGSNPTDMAQVWRNSGGSIVSSMSATGVMKAGYFIGNGSLLTNVTGSPAGTPLTSANIWVGNASDLAAAVAMSGDATLSNSGVLTLKNTGTAGTYAVATTDAQGRVASGSNTSASLASAITDETGAAGSVVFSNGPAFTGIVSVGTVSFNNAGANRLYFGNTGVGPPGAGGAGQKIQLYGSAGTVGGSDYALGVESNHMWFNTNAGYKFYEDSSPRVVIASGGNIGLSTGVPQARLDVLAAGSNPTDMAQVWRNSGGSIVSSMSATGVMKASYFIGNGSLLTNVTGSPAGTQLTSANIWVGNASNFAAAVAVSGDATMSNAGVVTIGNDKVTAAKISQGTAGQLLMSNSTPDTTWTTMSGDATISGSGALTLKNTGTAGTYRYVTTDAQGRVTSGSMEADCAGMTKIGSGRGAYCIDSTLRGSQSLYNASMTCLNAGYYLCSYVEYYTACTNQGWNDNAWVDGAASEDSIGAYASRVIGCDDLDDYDVDSGSGFRCCVR